MAKYIVPSKAASGAQTFNDGLVGNQITNGTNQLTNTNFDIDRVIPEKDSKNFKTSPFSEFLTLDTLNKNTNQITNTNSQTTTQDNTIKFNSAKKDAGVSLFGSLSSRILVAITNIINKFPSGFLIDKDGFISATEYTANDIIYNDVEKSTEFSVEVSRIFNPFDIKIKKPNTNVVIETDNNLRNYYSAYKNYVIEVSGSTYEILDYNEPDFYNVVKFKVSGDPFSGSTGYTENILVRPKNGIVEEFFKGLDILETQLLNRETNPIYTSTFIVPKDNNDGSNTVLTPLSYTWPISKDNWNIQITGLKYNNYVTNLSDVANEIDDYKSNLIVRFLSSPQLFEFDTDDKKGESIFQLYGQSFDNVKKFIDNITYMRNVSYDSINNLPDILLKNLSETLGLSTVNLFDEKKFEDSVYTRLNRQYEGESIGKNLVESEYEFYRRLLVNLAFIYKSKGTRTAIEFFLKFLGAPEPLIKIDEYVYQVSELPKSKNLEDDIYDVIQGSKVFVNLTFNTSTYSYEKTITSGFTTFTRDGYPVVENSLEPRRAFSLSDDIFFQKGSGWYDVTLDHRASDILDTENSILTGRTKTLKTKMKPYTYGEDYFDVFRTLPGLDTGYVLDLLIDNDKTGLVTENSKYILNRKNIGIYISPSRAIDYDIWSKSRDLFLAFGSNTLYPQTGMTFAEFLDLTIHSQIKNSNVIRYKKNYNQLEDVYNSYINSTGFTPYNYIDSNEFIIRMSPYWVDLVSQIIPATTLWTGGNLIENSIFGRSKYKYVQPCQPLEFIENLYPDFETAIEEDLETLLGQEENFRGLIEITGVTYYPTIEIDGIVYSGETYSVVVSGTSNTPNSATLLNSQFEQLGCTSLETNDYLPLICDYKNYVEPDINKIKELWLIALTGLIDEVINKSQIRYTAGYYDYAPYTAVTSGTTHETEFLPILTYETFVDIDGIEKIKFTSVKYGYGKCSIKNYLQYTFEAIYSPVDPTCHDNVNFSVYCDVYAGGTEECEIKSDVYFNLEGIVSVQEQGNGEPVYFYNDCNSDNTLPIQLSSGRTLEYISGCTYKISNVYEHDDIKLNLLDAANCEIKLYINGLQLKAEYDPYAAPKSHYENILITSQDELANLIEEVTGSTWCDNYTGYTIIPNYEIRKSLNYGLKHDTYVYVVQVGSQASLDINNGVMTNTLLKDYIDLGQISLKEVKSIVVGDILLCVNDNLCSTLSNQQFQDANINGYSFSFTYNQNMVSSIDCLGSIKKSLVTGKTLNGDLVVFEILPTTELKVYTNKKINNGIIETVNYHFDYRFPEDLIIKGLDKIEPCCYYGKNYYEHGDYLIDVYGNLIEVIDVDLNYCESNLYYNFNVYLSPTNGVPDYLNIFNGESQFIYIRQKYDLHYSGLTDVKVEQYFSSINCNNIPPVGSLERPNYPTVCDNKPVVKCSPSSGFTACLFEQIESPTFVYNNLVCGGGDQSYFNVTISSLIVNGIEYVTSPIVSETITSSNLNLITSNSIITSWCGSAFENTYTNFVDFLNDTFTSFGLTGYTAQNSLYDYTFVNSGRTSLCNGGFFLIHPDGDTFDIRLSGNFSVHDTVHYTETGISIEGYPIIYPMDLEYGVKSFTCNLESINATLDGNTVIENGL